MDPKERNIWIVVALLLAGAIAYVAYMKGAEVPPKGMPEERPGGAICTMEAKQCPDGSYVGRQGPNCEFAPCPGAQVDVDVR